MFLLELYIVPFYYVILLCKVEKNNGTRLQIVQITRKLQTVLPGLKAPILTLLQSDIVYSITCPLSEAQ